MVIGFDVVSCGDHVPSMLYITILPILAVSFEIATELKSVNVAVHVFHVFGVMVIAMAQLQLWNA